MKYFAFFILFAFAISTPAQMRSGAYDRTDKQGDLTIKENKKGFYFAVLAHGKSEAPCFGQFKGQAKWISANIAEFNGDFNANTGCRLTFSFSSNQLIVRETNCEDYHGASCNFEATYRKRIKRAKRK
jgi:hypothetical protein